MSSAASGADCLPGRPACWPQHDGAGASWVGAALRASARDARLGALPPHAPVSALPVSPRRCVRRCGQEIRPAPSGGAAPRRLRVLSANLCLEHPSREPARWASALRAGGFDVLALQECMWASPGVRAGNVGVDIAAALGFRVSPHRDAGGVAEHDGDQCTLWSPSAAALGCREPAAAAAPHDAQDGRPPPPPPLLVRSVHLTDWPETPERLARGELCAAGAAAESRAAARAAELAAVLAEVAGAPAVILCGDFNEPSHLDNGLSGSLAAAWHISSVLQAAGFRDAYREAHPAEPGATWPTCLYAVPHAGSRIDFIMYRGRGLRLLGCDLLPLEDAAGGALSDHAGLAATFELLPPAALGAGASM
jgi:endonuclease/exonuclease/phosphatase family metal-dependent hydrolase